MYNIYYTYTIHLLYYIGNSLHILEVMILVRLSKVIGTNRDVILAGNIQDTAREFEVGCILYIGVYYMCTMYVKRIVYNDVVC